MARPAAPAPMARPAAPPCVAPQAMPPMRQVAPGPRQIRRHAAIPGRAAADGAPRQMSPRRRHRASALHRASPDRVTAAPKGAFAARRQSAHRHRPRPWQGRQPRGGAARASAAIWRQARSSMPSRSSSEVEAHRPRQRARARRRTAPADHRDRRQQTTRGARAGRGQSPRGACSDRDKLKAGKGADRTVGSRTDRRRNARWSGAATATGRSRCATARRRALGAHAGGACAGAGDVRRPLRARRQPARLASPPSPPHPRHRLARPAVLAVRL